MGSGSSSSSGRRSSSSSSSNASSSSSSSSRRSVTGKVLKLHSAVRHSLSTEWRSLTNKVGDPFDPGLSTLNFGAMDDFVDDLGQPDMPAQPPLVVQGKASDGGGVVEARPRRTYRCLLDVVKAEIARPVSPVVQGGVPEGADAATTALIRSHTATFTWACRAHHTAPGSSDHGKPKAGRTQVAGHALAMQLRPLTQFDQSTLQAGLSVLSTRSKLTRFFATVDSFSPETLQVLCDSSTNTRFAWGLAARCGSSWVAVGVGRYVCERKDPTRAEMALTLLDRWQGLGLASLLAFVTSRAAFDHGVKTLTGVYLAKNSPVDKLLTTMVARSPDAKIHIRSEGELKYFDMALPLGFPEEALPLCAADAARVAAAAVGMASTTASANPSTSSHASSKSTYSGSDTKSGGGGAKTS
eukprot:INCI16439.4.p2 GENE.INCI16439.4~~INCI16439.4.p2  ORF type:complete len:412 (+),score=72.14 INCI16439.4:30-1265(+)